MPDYVINGSITCAPDELDMFLTAVKEHEALTRAEPGCLEFSITQSAPGSCIFNVRERFVDRAAFDIHTKRTRASAWWRKTQHISRDLKYSA